MTVTQDAERILEQIRHLLEQGERERALGLLASLLPADKASLFETLDLQTQERLLPSVDADDAADIMEEMDDDDAAALAEQLDTALLTQVLNEMEPDEAADLLGDLSPQLRFDALQGMESPEEVRPLLRYPDDSAGGLMTSDYYMYPEQMSVGRVFRDIREQPPRDEEIPFVYAVDEEGRLTGAARLADLIRAHSEQPLSAITQAEVLSVRAFDDQESVTRLINRYDLMAVPVLDDRARLVGVITADDAIAAQEEEVSEDFYGFAGIISAGGEEAARSDLLVRGPVWRAWKVRVPFLVITLLGSMLAGTVIGAYEHALESVIILAMFIPVVMTMGGNAGSQSTEIFIRGHALGQIETGRFARHLLREIIVGIGMGIIMGIVAGIIAAVWQGLPRLGLTVGISMVGTMTVAASMGFIVPFILLKLGFDPAAGAIPFITTMIDIIGLLVYFVLATSLLGYMLP